MTIDLSQKTGGENLPTVNSNVGAVALDDTAGGHAAGDILIGIENLIGSDHDDVLIGDAADNILIGGAGNDRLAGGSGIDKFVLGGIDDGTDIISDFSSFDRVLIQIETALAEQPADLADLLTALGLTLDGGTDRTGNGAFDTAIMQGDTELMILEGINAVEWHVSYFEVEVI